MKLFLLTILSIVMVSFTAHGQDSFLFDKKLYRFDSLYEGEVSNAVFLFKNTGKDTLYISVKPYCSCIHVTYSDAPIYPGKCSMIQGQFNSHGKLGLFNDGMDVTISENTTSNESKEQKVFLPVEAIILKGKRPQTKIKFAANQFDLGKVEIGEGKYFKIDFKNEGQEGLSINDIKLSGVPFFYSFGYYYPCKPNEEKPLVGTNEIIHKGQKGSILFKLGKTDLAAGVYETTVIVSGNFKNQKIKLKFEVVN